MKNSKLLLVLALFALAFVSCKKDHYDVSQVHGVAAEGELLLPVASASYTMMGMMQRFQIDSLITFSEDGGMSFTYDYDYLGAVKGSELLHFKDWEYEAHYSIENPYSFVLPEPIDTVFSMSQDVEFVADHIHVVSALMKSGHFEFDLSTNVGSLGQVIITTSDIKDIQGRDFRFVYQPQTGQTGFDMAGLHYQTDEPNTLTFNYEIHAVIQEIAPEMEFGIRVVASDLSIQEMSGSVDKYESSNRIDTVFKLFPEKLSGSLDIKGARLNLSERNTFDLNARLFVDTALVYGNGIAPYSIFNPMPVDVYLPKNSSNQVFSQSLNGKLNAEGGQVMASSLFTVYASEMDELVTVADTCNIDVFIDVDIPFSFSIDDVRYLDTVDMNISEIEMPEMIEKLTIELTFNSTLPLNLGGQFYMYDSQLGQITDTLLADTQLIAASFDGQPITTTLSIDVTEDRVENVMHSDKILMLFKVDTDARDVEIKAYQKLDMFTKARVKYNGTVELKKD